MSIPRTGRDEPFMPRRLLLPVLPWEGEKVYADGDAYYRDLLGAIDRATREIDLETYIFQLDFLGREFIRALAGAARRGVRVRVMVDGIGSPTWAGMEIESLEAAGVLTKIFHPAPWHIWQFSRARWSRRRAWVPRIIWLFRKVNRRDHRKLCVIDGRTAWVGSMNVSAVHLSRVLGGEGWRDTSVRLAGEGVAVLQEIFEGLWSPMRRTRIIRRRFNHDPAQLRRFPVRTNETRFKRRFLYKDLLERIASARGRVWITNAYFVPDYRLLRSLCDAAGRGVDVRLLLPAKSDVPVIPLASSVFYSELLEAGVRIFEYSAGILHAKTLLIDRWSLVGSSNLNHRSLLHDYELDVVLTSDESVSTLERQFLEDLDRSEEILLDHWRHEHWVRNWTRRVLGWLVLRMRYWL